MRSMWKGAVSFGLVHVPIKLFAATEDKDVRFNLLHRECHTPIQYQKRCPACNREVAQEELVKGFEYEKGRYAIVTEEDLTALEPEGNRAIAIQSFVDLKEIDPIYFAKTYYLAPDQHGQKAYALLRSALAGTGRLAIAKVILRNKESLAALRVYGEGLAMHLMLFPEEIRSMDAIGDLGQGIEVSDKEQTMAVQLIESLTEPFQAEKWRNDHRERVLELIEAKVQGQGLVEGPKAPAPVQAADLLDALKASIQMAKEQAKAQAAMAKKGVKKERRKTS